MEYKTLYLETKSKYIHLQKAGMTRSRVTSTTFGSFDLKEVPEIDKGEFLKGVVSTLSSFGIGDSLNLNKLNSKSSVMLTRKIAYAEEKEGGLVITRKGRVKLYNIIKYITRGAFNEISYITSIDSDTTAIPEIASETASVSSSSSSKSASSSTNAELILRKSKSGKDFNNDIYENILHVILYQYSQVILATNPIVKPIQIAISRDRNSVYCIMENGGITFLDYMKKISDLEEKERNRLILDALESIYIRITTLSNVIQFVHGDLKPNNILCEFDPKTFEITSMKFIDFGYSKFTIIEGASTIDFWSENAKLMNQSYPYNSCKDFAFLVLSSILMVPNEQIKALFKKIGEEVIEDFAKHSKRTHLLNLYYQTYNCKDIDFDELKLTL